MALFQTDGWSLPNKIVKGEAKKKEKKGKDKKLRKPKSADEESFNNSRELQTDETHNEEPRKKSGKPKRRAEEELAEDSQDMKSKHEREANNDGTKPKSKKSKKAKTENSSGKSDVAEQPSAAPESLFDNSKLTPLQQKMLAKLSGSRFRWINEQLYTTNSENALKLVKEQPNLFEEYHTGFRNQVQSWPENPVDKFVDLVKERTEKPVGAPGGLPCLASKEVVIADMGCGEAMFALQSQQAIKEFNASIKRDRKKKPIKLVVHSFDLKAVNDRITVADIKNVPLPDNSCSIVIFCLALMGTNFLDFIKEAWRILNPRGELWIAEIKSRFSDDQGEEFIDALKRFGFFHKKSDNTNKMFIRFEFFKPPMDILMERRNRENNRKKFINDEEDNSLEALERKRQAQPEGNWLLKPCIYKKR